MEMLSDMDDPRQPSNGTRHDDFLTCHHLCFTSESTDDSTRSSVLAGVLDRFWL